MVNVSSCMRYQSVRNIAQILRMKAGQLSLFTVLKRLHKSSLFVRRPERCTPLTTAYQKVRISRYWSYVLFITITESFIVKIDSQCYLIWSELKTWFYPTNHREKRLFRQTYCRKTLRGTQDCAPNSRLRHCYQCSPLSISDSPPQVCLEMPWVQTLFVWTINSRYD